MKNFKIRRNVDIGTHRLNEIFSGIENCKTLWKVFGSKKKFLQILQEAKVTVSKKPWLIWVNPKNGNVMTNKNYLQKTGEKILYLDIVHELVHVKQFLDGKELFDERFGYVERPTEIEAYRATVEEARNIGMSEKEIIDYLKVDWIDNGEHKKLVESVME